MTSISPINGGGSDRVNALSVIPPLICISILLLLSARKLIQHSLAVLASTFLKLSRHRDTAVCLAIILFFSSLYEADKSWCHIFCRHWCKTPTSTCQRTIHFIDLDPWVGTFTSYRYGLTRYMQMIFPGERQRMIPVTILQDGAANCCQQYTECFCFTLFCGIQ